MLPRVVIHNVVSADGRTTGFTPNLGVFYQLASHWKEDATLAGCDTLLGAYTDVQVQNPPESKEQHDAAEAESSASDEKRPLLVVPDSRGRLRCWPRLRNEPYWRDVIALVSDQTPTAYLADLDASDIRHVRAGDDHVDLAEALRILAQDYGVQTVRVDSGGTLNAILLRAGLVHEVSLVIEPTLVGGVNPRTVFHTAAAAAAIPHKLKRTHCQELDGGLVWLRFEVVVTA